MFEKVDLQFLIGGIFLIELGDLFANYILPVLWLEEEAALP